MLKKNSKCILMILLNIFYYSTNNTVVRIKINFFGLTEEKEIYNVFAPLNEEFIFLRRNTVELFKKTDKGISAPIKVKSATELTIEPNMKKKIYYYKRHWCNCSIALLFLFEGNYQNEVSLFQIYHLLTYIGINMIDRGFSSHFVIPSIMKSFGSFFL